MAEPYTSDTRSLPQLLSDLTTDLATLFRKEVQLVRVEIGEKAGQLGKAAGEAAVGAVLLLSALFFILLAAMFALAAVIGLVWASLVMGVVLGIAGAVLVGAALKDAKPQNLKLERSARQVQDTVRLAKEQVR